MTALSEIAGSLSWRRLTVKVVFVASPISRPSCSNREENRVSFSVERSRRSTVSTTRPGTTLVVFGEGTSRPTVATCRPDSARIASFTATVNFAAASIASWRWSIGVVPA